VRARRSPFALVALVVLTLSIVLTTHGSAMAQRTTGAWTTSNIGDPVLFGSASPIAATDCVLATPSCAGFVIDAGGTDIWDARDEFVFAWTPLQGDGAIVARVRDLQQTDPWAKAGLMLRESLAGDSRHASIFVTPTQGVAFQRRTEPGGFTTHTYGSAAASPQWLKLERRGSLVVAYESVDGRSWTLVGSDVLETGASMYVGIAVTSHNPWTATTATVTDVSVTTNALSSDWSYADVGGPAISGAAASSENAFSVAGAGADVWEAWDQFAFVYQPVLGDADIVAHVAGLAATHPWTKAGLMVRGSLSGDSAHGFAMVTGSNGISFQGRPESSGPSQQFGVLDGAAPAWVKLERRGVVVNAYTSADGAQWTPIGSAVIELSGAVYIGMAVTSHDASQIAAAVFDSVTVRELSVAGNMRPTVTMTSPSTGSLFTAPATVTLAANASDADGSIGWVEFYSGAAFLGSASTSPYALQVSDIPAGTYSVTARAFDNRSESSVSAPVWFTVSDAAAPPLTYVAFTPSLDHGTLVQRYVFEVFLASTGPSGALVAMQDLGVPPIVAGEISANVAATLSSLSSGSYVAVVSAVGASGASASEPAGFSR
jgi:regulation of enolase protein 1 (concanavalin A-like superfamily)